MRFGIVGLGRMGSNVARHALERGHEVVGYNRERDATDALAAEGLDPAFGLDQLVSKLPSPRVVLIYVPHGEPTTSVCDALRTLLSDGDVVADCGNSHWEDSKRRATSFAERGIAFLDIGTSGGVDGARRGACFMAGGPRTAFERVKPLLLDLAVDDAAVVHAGASGAGHFTKLVHNAVEFGMVQSIAEGVEMLARSGFDLDLEAVLENWNHGSVIRSWLVELMAAALAKADFEQLATYVEDTGEVKWVLQWALERDVPTPVVAQAQASLMTYRDVDSAQAKAVALMRNAFGGHRVHTKEDARANGSHLERESA